MTICYVLPGILGTELGTGPQGQSLLWVSYTRLALGEVGGLWLDTDGTSPKAPFGRDCSPRGPLRDYYDSCVSSLTRDLGPHGYTVQPWGYDFRLDIIGTGARLAAEIRANVSASDPCAIVAHSQGGLVSRAAWSALGGTGEQNLVRRIVTLGTPHQGSYAPVRIWSLDDPQLDQMQLITTLLAFGTFVVPVGVHAVPWSLEALSQLLASWPALYQMLPVLGSPDAAPDPHRNYLYLSGNWPQNRGILQDWLDNAAGPMRAFLLSPSSLPPAEVLTTVSGNGIYTPNSLKFTDELGSISALGFTDEADGSVTRESALVSGSKTFVFNCRHSDLPSVVALNGDLADMVREVRVAPVPPLPTIKSAVPINPMFAGPPIPTQLWPDHDC